MYFISGMLKMKNETQLRPRLYLELADMLIFWDFLSLDMLLKFMLKKLAVLDLVNVR